MKKSRRFCDPRALPSAPLGHPRGMARVRVDCRSGASGSTSCGPEAGRGAGVRKLGEPDPIPPGPCGGSSGRPVSPSGCPRLSAPTPAALLLPAAGAALPAADAARAARLAGPGAGRSRLGPRCAPGLLRSSAALLARNPAARQVAPEGGARTRGGEGGEGAGRGAEPASSSGGRRRAAPPSGPCTPAPAPPPRLPSPFSHFPCLSPHRPPGLPAPAAPVLSFSFSSALPHPPRPLASSPRPPHVPSSFAFRPAASFLVWAGCLCLCPSPLPQGFPSGLFSSQPSPICPVSFLYHLLLPVGRQASWGWMRCAPAPSLLSSQGQPPSPCPASMPANAGKL